MYLQGKGNKQHRKRGNKMYTFKIETGYGVEVRKVKAENLDKAISILQNKCKFSVLNSSGEICFKNY